MALKPTAPRSPLLGRTKFQHLAYGLVALITFDDDGIPVNHMAPWRRGKATITGGPNPTLTAEGMGYTTHKTTYNGITYADDPSMRRRISGGDVAVMSHYRLENQGSPSTADNLGGYISQNRSTDFVWIMQDNGRGDGARFRTNHNLGNRFTASYSTTQTIGEIYTAIGWFRRGGQTSVELYDSRGVLLGSGASGTDHSNGISFGSDDEWYIGDDTFGNQPHATHLIHAVSWDPWTPAMRQLIASDPWGFVRERPRIFSVATGPQTISLAFISSGSAVYAPSVNAGLVSVTIGFVPSGATVYTPSLNATYSITLDFISSGATVYEPSMVPGTASLTLDFISSGSAVYAPSMVPGAATVTLDFIPSGATVYAPTLLSTQNLNLDFISSGSQVFAPSMVPGAAPITLDFIPSGATVYEPTLKWDQAISLAFISSGSQVYEPTVPPAAIQVTLDFISSGATVYAPSMVPGVAPVTLNFISSASVVYAPSVNAGPYTISLDFIPSGATVYAPTLVQDTAQTISLDYISSGSQVFAPSMVPGTATITLGFIASGAVVYFPLIDDGTGVGLPPKVRRLRQVKPKDPP